MTAQEDPHRGASHPVTTVTAQRQPASSARRSVRWALLAWWLLPLLYFAWLTHNVLPLLPSLTQTAPGALLAQLLALPHVPSIAGVALPSQAAAVLPAFVAVCVAFLALLGLGLAPRPVAPIAAPAVAHAIAPNPMPPTLPDPSAGSASPTTAVEVPASPASTE